MSFSIEGRDEVLGLNCSYRLEPLELGGQRFQESESSSLMVEDVERVSASDWSWHSGATSG